ncbi:response regulator transcription factor [Steroidobacter sp. S1-65]|uniref:Response regulator transcription factor n=1 Tax=Steroidobacter gossypii TaxID=2805490 RepID=A0ABS1X601_9GAMM|nr:LytTR family DNA-binding domain-containing protein [Steroidobacter gossypii]MBM0108654.1 response regulator transcription factor [Steroidobacter gossypii]
MSPQRPTALIADDEPLLRDALERMLAQAWPALHVVAQARNGREAIDKFEALHPAICFLDVHMPGVTGIEVAQHIGRRAHLVFVTAYDQYAVQAFSQGVLDYLVKPVEPRRLADTVARLQERLSAAQPALNTEELLEQLAARLRPAPSSSPLRWVRASIGQTVRLIPVEDIDFLRSDEKYTVVAWRDDAQQPREAVIRTPLKDIIGQLDASRFAQVHRSVVVNLNAIDHVTRGANETAELHLKGRSEVLPVSRTYLHLFRQM